MKVIDVKTAFLNAHLPDSMETVYVRPPQALIEFGLVAPGTIWRVVKAIYGLRISPKAWGVERDRQLRQMDITVKGTKYLFQQSHIDPPCGSWCAVVSPPRGRTGEWSRNLPGDDAVYRPKTSETEPNRRLLQKRP